MFKLEPTIFWFIIYVLVSKVYLNLFLLLCFLPSDRVLESNHILKMIKAKSQENVSFEMFGKHLPSAPLKPR